MSDLRLYRGMTGQKEIPLGSANTDPKPLADIKPDAPMHQTSESASLMCGCGRIRQRGVWVVRCGVCAGQSYPRAALFSGCEDCGGFEGMTQRWNDHRRGVHGI